MASRHESVTIGIVGEARRAQVAVHEHVEKRTMQGMERLRSTSKTRKSIETRERIMSRATDIMVERGNTAFQMSEVSRRCGMSKGALYYYFSDREDLVRAVFDRALDDLVEGVDSVAVRQLTPEETLKGICNEFADRARAGGPLAMALVRDLAHSRDGETPEGSVRILHIVGVIERLLELAKDAGTVREDVDSHLVATSIVGAFTFAALRFGGDAAIEADFADVLFDIIVRGVGVLPDPEA